MSVELLDWASGALMGAAVAAIIVACIGWRALDKPLPQSTKATAVLVALFAVAEIALLLGRSR